MPKVAKMTAGKAAPKITKAEEARRAALAAHAALEGIDDFDWSDTGMADRVFARHGAGMRFVTEEREAWVYSKERGVWGPDPQGHILQRAIEETIRYCADVLAEEIDDPEARGKYRTYLQASLSRRARVDALHLLLTKLTPVSVNAFDADPWISNALNGIIDLRTCELLPHRPESMCSKQIDLVYDPDAKCELFEEKLLWMMGGGPDATPEAQERAVRRVEFLQRLFGCCSTGVFEKMLVFFYGALGNNGKSVCLDLTREALGPYSGQLQIDALIADRGPTSNNINSDLMQLKGMRMVVSSEPDQDAALNVARVKYWTGGGKKKARRLRADPVEFDMIAKMIVETNHLPKVSNASDAVFNRVHCVPFERQVVGDDIDTTLRDKLRTELPGILAWIVWGASQYADRGIDFPAEFSLITQGYRVAADHFPAFLEDAVIADANASVFVKDLRATYDCWCKTNAETPLGNQAFKSRLEQAGYTQGKAKQTRAWLAMRLVKAPPGLIARSLAS